MDGGDDFFTGAEDAPEQQQGGYNDLGSGEYGATGGDYGGGDFNGGGFDQQPNGEVAQANGTGFDNGMGFQQDNMGYATLDDPSGGSGGNGGMGEMPDMGMPAPEDVEPSALDEFMERWQAGLVEKARIEAEAKAAALEAAKADLETHSVERAANKEAKMGQNREQEQIFLEQLEGELESENPWERVVSLVDTQSEVVEDFKDTSRMTSILIQLKNDPIDTSSTAAAS
ncbi:Clathrin light chain [Ectocarpus siliculosus]|uniref:Clathrin light chain n=1 Tax=Ectocarpus siliculosus TaxID=2880 RepID=D7G9H3_ECTSI|nr:Clathrin light chain [Ectocarpus siliculosus]|eukprot:CBJ28313.1 Clathrin light chain [Ectocarpus siliculosus]